MFARSMVVRDVLWMILVISQIQMTLLLVDTFKMRGSWINVPNKKAA
jgi:hypothetical protein